MKIVASLESVLVENQPLLSYLANVWLYSEYTPSYPLILWITGCFCQSIAVFIHIDADQCFIDAIKASTDSVGKFWQY